MARNVRGDIRLVTVQLVMRLPLLLRKARRVNEEAKLRIHEPLRRLVLIQRLPRRLINNPLRAEGQKR